MENMIDTLMKLNSLLLEEMPTYKEQAASFSDSIESQKILLRSLMNVRPPLPLDENFLQLQDYFLKSETLSKGVVKLDDLSPASPDSHIYLWQGDITRLAVDAIVNAANSALLGCFSPCHGCIDNAIHSAAGLQLRRDCDEIMKKQGHEEHTGSAKITNAYNLPSKYVLHTVGPIIYTDLTQNDRVLLENCYKNCLELAISNNLKSIAFCCISTGEFRFPNDKAAKIAIDTVKNMLNNMKNEMEVIFNVFKDRDYEIYRDLLGANQ